MSSNSPPPNPQTSTPLVTSTGSNQTIFTSGPTTYVTGTTLVSQPSLMVQSQGFAGSMPKTLGQMDESQPVDLASVKKTMVGAPLKIPAVPLRPAPPRPTVTNISFRPANSMPMQRPSAVVTVPKPGQVNMAVMQQQGNKMTVLQGPPGTQKIITTGPATIQTQVSAPGSTPRLTTATTVIRAPQVAFPMTIRAPLSSPTTASIRLTTAGQASAPMQFVPVSLANLPLRPSGQVTVRPATVGFRPSVVRQPTDTTISPVRVTLMQQPGGVKVGQTHTGPGPQAGFYKPVTITTQNPPTLMTPTSGPVRIGPIPTSRMAVVPAGTQNLTVSMTNPGSHMNLPLAGHNLVAKQTQQTQQQGMHPRLPGNVAVPIVSSGGVTIQKANVGMTGQTTVVSTARTIALPYGTSSTIVATSQPTMATLASSIASGKLISTSTSTTTTIPVARVCPQPLSSVAGGNLVTISTTGALTGTSQDTGGVFITRTNSGQPLQQLAINLSTSAAGQFQQNSNNVVNKQRSNLNLVTHLNMPKLGLSNQPRLISFQGQQPGFMVGPQIQEQLADPHQQQRLPTNSPRPSILRRREGERELILPGSPASPPPRPDSRDDASSSSSGSTTLSATSSPDVAAENLSGCDESVHTQAQLHPTNNNSTNTQQESGQANEPSPRKKPRKQQLPRMQENQWSESEENFTAVINEELKRKVPQQLHQEKLPQVKQEQVKDPNESNYIRDKPRASLLSDYRPNWKPRLNHFLRHTDVKAKDERRPTVNELSNQKFVLQKVNGWKIYHLTSQMEDIIDIETELTQRLSELQKRLEKAAHPDIAGKEVAKVQELIKANLQRSKVIQDQISEARESAIEIFDHKPKIISIIHKYESKRHVKKRVEHGK